MIKKLKVKSPPLPITNPPIPPFSKGGLGGITGEGKGRGEQGFVLVVALLALLVVTVLGVLALSTSTTEVMVAGNTRLREMNFSGAESGLEISDPTLRFIVYNQPTSQAECPNYSSIVSNCATLATELRSGPAFDGDLPANNPDLQLPLGSMTVRVDIDYMFPAQLAGSSIEFASGYEGIGMGAGSGGIEVYYRVNSVSSDNANLGSEAILGGVYRYVSY
jgi:Tfp pilus assembly protein PilX